MGNFYKIILSFAIGILLPLEFFGQTDQNNEKGKVEKSSELNYQVLTYQPSPPAPGSYKIIKNDTNEPRPLHDKKGEINGIKCS